MRRVQLWTFLLGLAVLVVMELPSTYAKAKKASTPVSIGSQAVLCVNDHSVFKDKELGNVSTVSRTDFLSEGLVVSKIVQRTDQDVGGQRTQKVQGLKLLPDDPTISTLFVFRTTGAGDSSPETQPTPRPTAAAILETSNMEMPNRLAILRL